MRNSRKLAVIIGGTGEIGAALAIKLLESDWGVAVVGRSEQKLASFRSRVSGAVMAFRADASGDKLCFAPGSFIFLP